MPNYVRNIVRISGEESRVNELCAFVAEGENAFSFQKIIPMPPELSVFSGSIGECALSAVMGSESNKEYLKQGYQGWSRKGLSEDLSYMTGSEASAPKSFEDAMYLGSKLKENIEKFGYKDWYDWRRQNWGTKWNSGEVSCNKTAAGHVEFIFDTAWSVPIPVFSALTERFPDLVIAGVWADENIGSSDGTWVRVPGKSIMCMEPTSKEEAVAFAENVWNMTSDEIFEVALLESRCGLANPGAVDSGDMPELIGQLIDMLEDYLTERDVKLENSERDDDEEMLDEGSAALIYGSHYGELQTALEGLFDALVPESFALASNILDIFNNFLTAHDIRFSGEENRSVASQIDSNHGLSDMLDKLEETLYNWNVLYDEKPADEE